MAFPSSTLVHLLFGINIVVLVSSQCLNDQQQLLLQLKSTLNFHSPLSTKLIHWNDSTDCCVWGGVTCDNIGHVVGLDLSNESISGGFDHHPSALFSLRHLQSLNLAFNRFNLTKIPHGFGNLTGLTYLNLSNSRFAGQIPMEISSLTRLVTLDFSVIYGLEIQGLKVENLGLSMLIQNLRELRELYLDGINMSSQGEWCNALSSSSPNLQVLSLSNCFLSGPIDPHLMNLRSLSVIRLDNNNLSTTVPGFFANFTNLTALHLPSCNLHGTFPKEILQVPTLRTLDLSDNGLLQGVLPEFPRNGSLIQTLLISRTNFSGTLPNSMANLTQLVYLDLSSNMFTGAIPSFHMSKNLTHIDLSHNDLMGPIPWTHFEGLSNLVHIDLHYNLLSGSIPSSLFALPSLQKILFSFNQFSGRVDEFSNTSSSLLNTLDLSSNNLGGPIPTSFSELERLNVLLLSSNNFSGSIKLEIFKRLNNLTTLDLSYNNLLVNTGGTSSSMSYFPQITLLRLASCKLQSFPNLKDQSSLFDLDLSDNQIDGEIPNWIWNIGNGSLYYLNLSHNSLVDVQEPYVIPSSLNVLDLHSNQLHGEVPRVPEFAVYVDYSSNDFSSSIPADFGNSLTVADFFSLSNNRLTGTIPQSICSAFYLQVLDLSNNSLNGTIPSCLIENNTQTLGVLNLRNNTLGGSILGTFPGNCSLKTLDFNGNHLEGQVPKSLANCTMLDVLNLGNNKITDSFPCFLKNSSSLHVLVLRSNNFFGGIGCQEGNSSYWPNLQIIDLSFNNLSGNLPSNSFLNLKAMMVDEDNSRAKSNHLRFEFLQFSHFYYEDTVTVTNKGLEMKLVKILSIFTAIDFSNNKFQGKIPDAVGKLKSLYVLNLSNNSFVGSIPASIQNLKQLESLDLSQNKLSGEIPVQLASLTFLSFLNVSYNLLVGRIPGGSQFQTFSEISFLGNEGLCGFPLNRSCNDTEVRLSPAPTFEENHAFLEARVYLSAELGFVVGLGIIIGPLAFYRRWRQWYYKHVDRLFLRTIELRRQQRRAYRNPIRRL